MVSLPRRPVLYRLDPDCPKCQEISEYRKARPQDQIANPDMVLIDTGNPPSLNRHSHRP